VSSPIIVGLSVDVATQQQRGLVTVRNAAGSCSGTLNDGDVLIQIVPRGYHRKPTMAEGYVELPDIGTEGNVTPDMGGWIAAAIVGEESFIASVAGEGSSADQATALLRETIKRRG
jgi:hypothetical protein